MSETRFILVELSEGSTEVRSYQPDPPKPTAIARHASGVFVVLDFHDARREGVRMEFDLATADETAKALRRAITEWRKRTGGAA